MIILRNSHTQLIRHRAAGSHTEREICLECFIRTDACCIRRTANVRAESRKETWLLADLVTIIC